VRNVLKACEGLLGEMPFEQITVDDIASRAGVPVSSMYFFFQDRLSIFFHLIEVALKDIGHEYARADQEANQTLPAYVRGLEQRLALIWSKHKDMIDLFFAYRVHPSVSQMVVEVQAYIDGRVARQLAHHFPSMSPSRRSAAARVINGALVQGLDIASALSADRAKSFAAEWSGMLHAYVEGLKT
jgi:AcrR family transcriptional regulator